jgi:hypothetical protein
MLGGHALLRARLTAGAVPDGVPNQAQEQLFHARRILGYSYAFAFWMFDGDLYAAEISAEQNARNQNLFEDQQQQLESQVGGACLPRFCLARHVHACEPPSTFLILLSRRQVA